MPRLEAICIRPAGEPASVPLTRTTCGHVDLIAGHGIDGDAKAGHPKRQINLIAIETLDDLAQRGFDTSLGRLGEQMRVSGIRLDQLSAGDFLTLGAAMVEITSTRNGCTRFADAQPAGQGKPSLGVLARVVRGGRVSVGDEVQVILADDGHA